MFGVRMAFTSVAFPSAIALVALNEFRLIPGGWAQMYSGPRAVALLWRQVKKLVALFCCGVGLARAAEIEVEMGELAKKAGFA